MLAHARLRCEAIAESLILFIREVNVAEVQQIIADVLGIDREQVVPELAYQSVAEWDSLNHVSLMLALEEKVGKEIDGDLMVELTSVRAILEFARQ